MQDLCQPLPLIVQSIDEIQAQKEGIDSCYHAAEEANCYETKTTKSARNNKAATPETQETCDGYLAAIPKDETLACSVCGVKLHRYCAGIPRSHYARVSTSFVCIVCSQNVSNAVQVELRQEITNLKAQVSELRAALAENTGILKEDISKLKKPPLKSSSGGQTYATTTATLNSRGQPNRRNGKIRQGPSMPGRAANVKASNSVAGGGSNKVQLTTSGSESEGSNHRTKVQVKGARKIWGTMAESTVRSVKNVITRFCNVAPGGLYVKRKDRVIATTNKSVWWYVVHADEKVLCDLESKWEPI